MAQRNQTSRAAARRQKDKWRAKRWYTIRAPRTPWMYKAIGETLAESEELLIGRIFEITQQEFDGDFTKLHVKLRFRITEVVGSDAITSFIGHETLKDHVRRQIRRHRTKFDAVVDAITDDGHLVRLKPLVITEHRVQASTAQSMRAKMVDIITSKVREMTYPALQQSLLSGELENQVREGLWNIHMTRLVMIRKSQLLQVGVVDDDGPTLDEVLRDETRKTAEIEAKKAAILAEQDGSEEEALEQADLVEEVEVDQESDDEESPSEDESPPGDEEEEAPPSDEIKEDSEAEAMDEGSPDYSSMTVAQLKVLLKEAGKPVSGKKDDLIARLNE